MFDDFLKVYSRKLLGIVIDIVDTVHEKEIKYIINLPYMICP